MVVRLLGRLHSSVAKNRKPQCPGRHLRRRDYRSFMRDKHTILIVYLSQAMRAKREPLTIHMPGQQSILLPRSHAHPPPPGYGPRPPPPLHAPQQQQQAAAQHMQQHQQQQAQAMARPPYPSAQYQPGGGPPPPPPGQGYPPPGYSTQSPAPYGNGVPLVRAPGFAESMSAVGLGGRDPNQLSDQEIVCSLLYSLASKTSIDYSE